MADLDTLAPNYRRAQQRWPDAPLLARSYEALVSCFAGNGHGMVELVKSFIECVCLTVMGELREPMPASTPTTTGLLVAALRPLGMRNTKGASKLDGVLHGFNKLADALSEMRNDNGPVAHGKDAFLDAVSADHARAYLHTGDAIVGVLLNAFEGKLPDMIATREPYEHFPHLNERIDRAVTVEARIDADAERPMVVFSVGAGGRGDAIELRVEPSRLLYGIDREAYVEVLRAADQALAALDEADAEAPETASPTAVGATSGAWITAGPVPEVVSTYDGPLAGLRPGLEAFLITEHLDWAVAIGDGRQLVDSLLATVEMNSGLDWKEREPLQARLKVSCKRVFVRFGLGPNEADAVTRRLVVWLRVQLPGGEVPVRASTGWRAANGQ